MSPAGGVGINLAIQDAVATANLLTRPLLDGDVREADLAAVQRRREFPTRVTQTVQTFAHRGLALAFANPGPIQAPWQVKAAMQIPGIHRVLGYGVGMGARPEHIRETAAPRARCSRLATAVCAGIGIAATAVALGCVLWKSCSRLNQAPHSA